MEEEKTVSDLLCQNTTFHIAFNTQEGYIIKCGLYHSIVEFLNLFVQKVFIIFI